jgi:hypothetical protein
LCYLSFVAQARPSRYVSRLEYETDSSRRSNPRANYTAIVRGLNNTTDIAVVEVFALQWR